MFISLPFRASTSPLICHHTRRTITYDHRLKRIGHPVRSAIHKLVIQWIDALNRANRHSVESEPLAALRGEARAEQGEQGEPRGEQGERGEATRRSRVNLVSVSR
jgi:hypothetical protein